VTVLNDDTTSPLVRPIGVFEVTTARAWGNALIARLTSSPSAENLGTSGMRGGGGGGDR